MLAAVVVTMAGPGLPLLPSPIALHFQRERLYFHCRAMKCLCMTAPRRAINLALAELTGQKPMQPLLGTEHYQCMDSLFIRGSIRHCSLCFHTEYETGQQVNAGHRGTWTKNRSQLDPLQLQYRPTRIECLFVWFKGKLLRIPLHRPNC